MSLEINGTLVKLLDKQTGISKAGKEWVKQSFVVDTGAKFNPEISFNLFGAEKVALLDSVNINDNINVAFNISSREYKGNYYTSADAWKIQQIESSSAFDDKFEGTTPNDLPF